MANTFGFGTDTTNFSSTVHDAIQKQVISTLRAGLIALPKGSVVPAVLHSQNGENFTLRSTAFPDLLDEATTAPLSEGVAPTPLKLAIDTVDWTVQQVGAWAKVTDLAAYQSPFGLNPIAAEKIARLAAQTIDNLALAALLAHGVDSNVGGVLSTKMVLDAVAILASRNVQPIPGVGYYALTNPLALRGLSGEASLNGYVQVTSEGASGDLSTGVVSQYRGVSFITSSRIVADGSSRYPVIFIGKESIAFGDISTIQYLSFSGAAPGNELAQYSGVGFKGILGGKVLAFSETTDGAGSTDAAVDRIYTIAVGTGINS
jgi:N4-gp56 family major capsid protein